MSELLVTQCPHCQTRFRLTPEQLAVANGHVRCGACLEVFHAADAAAALEEQPAVAPRVPAEPATSVPPTQSSLLEDDLDEDDAPEPDPDEPDLAALGLDESIISEVNPGAPGVSTADRGAEQPLSEPAPGSELADLHEDFIATPPARDFGPDFDHGRSSRYQLLTEDQGYTDRGIFQRDNPDSATTAPPEDLQTQTGSSGDAIEAPPGQAAITRPEPPLPPDDSLDPLPEETEPDQRTEPSVTTLQLELLEEELLGPDNRRRRSPSWLWSSLALLALLALPGQYLYYNFDALAHDQRSRPLLENLCLLARCELPARVDISRIRSTNLVVREHPEFPNALAIDVILYNRADFEQPFPVLEMQFTDAGGRRVTSRRFRPEEYLSGELAGVRLMPPQTPIHVGLSMLDPGPQARNYQLEFLSP